MQIKYIAIKISWEIKVAIHLTIILLTFRAKLFTPSSLIVTNLDFEEINAPDSLGVKAIATLLRIGKR